MEYTTLNNGVRMPLLGYGTWEVRGEEGCRCIRQALEVGYRLLDTARMYGNEEMVGRAVRQSGLPREEIFLTTKLYRPSASYEKARQGVEDSLRALGGGLHRPDADPRALSGGARHVPRPGGGL